MTKRNLRKIVNDTDSVRTKAGSMGVLKEGVWIDEKNEVVKYSLAYICHAFVGRITDACWVMTMRIAFTSGTTWARPKRRLSQATTC